MDTRVSLLVVCGITAALSIPLILRMVGPNSFYGFRTPRTRSRPEIWYPANVFAGWALLVAAVVSAATLWLSPAEFLSQTWTPLVVILVPLAVAVVASFVYLQRLG